MRNKIKILIFVTFLATLFFIIYNINNKLNYKNEVIERIKIMPNFSFLDIKGVTYTQNDLLVKPTIFIYFNSDCDYCHVEASKIEKRIKDFKNIQLIFISFEKKETIITFAEKYKLNNQKNIIFLEDRKFQFSKIFDVNSIPYIVIYDKNKKLLKKIKGLVKIDKIINAVK
jgi:peroxiredoxin